MTNKDKSDNFVVMAHIGSMICNIQDEKLQYTMMKAVFEYGTYSTDSEFENETEQCLWTLIKKTIDDMKAHRRTNNSTKTKPGRPAKQPSQVKNENAETAPVESESDDWVCTVPESNNTPSDVAALADEAAQEEKPTLDEVYEYCATQALSVNAQEFYTYYEKNAWRTKNGEKITNWRAMCERWAKPIGFETQEIRKPKAPKAPTQKNRNTEQFIREQWQAIEKMKAKYPKEWAIAINNRRRENPNEFWGLSEGETYRQMLKDNYRI